MQPTPRFVYFGGEPLGVPVLEELKAAHLLPSLIVCNPDRPVGRKQTLTPPPVKQWAEANGIPVYQPTSYKDEEVREKFQNEEWDMFVVVAYNFLLPAWLLEIPRHNVLNVHPSLLPKLRGASPIRTAIKDDLRSDIGVTVMLMDTKMDHGPILQQRPLLIEDARWPMAGPELDSALAHMGGAMLAKIIPQWIQGTVTPIEQLHDSATYCGKLTKDDSELHLNPLSLPHGDEAYATWLTINAFEGIGGTFFFHNGTRVKITAATYAEGEINIQRVIPENKSEMDFSQYLQSLT